MVGGFFNLGFQLPGGVFRVQLFHARSETGHHRGGEGGAGGLCVVALAAGHPVVITHCHHIGLHSSVRCRTERAEVGDFVNAADCAYGEDAVGIGGGNEHLPLFVVTFVTHGVTHQHTFAGCGVGSLGHHRSLAVHILENVALFSVSERAVHDVGAVLVGPLKCLHPPDLLFLGFGGHLGAGQQELRVGSHTEMPVPIHDARNAAQHHTAVRIGLIHILFLLHEVPGLDNLLVVTQMLERRVRVHIRETSVEHRDAHALAGDAVLLELFPMMDADLLGGVIAGLTFVDGVFGQFHVAGNQLNTSHKRKLLNDGNLFLRSHHTGRIEPPRRANQLLTGSLHLRSIVVVHRIVGDIIQVRTALRITLNGLTVKVLVWVEGGVLLVCEKHPITVLCG